MRDARRTCCPALVLQGMEVINDPDVEAVWICSPSQFHADQIKASAKAGKHIFCEKPIATDLAGTIEAVQVYHDGEHAGQPATKGHRVVG